MLKIEGTNVFLTDPHLDENVLCHLLNIANYG